ncbi:MAG: Bug family tripartite tricarboxylate transporter substrate binding protein [Micrococcaceae bacterium]
MFRNQKTRRRWVGGVTVAALAMALTACGNGSGGSENGEDFPSGSIDFILPNSPGGSTDIIGRALGNAMEEPMGVTITPVNREGANGAVGGKAALNSSADGYTFTMLFQSLMSITPLAVDDANPISWDDMDVLAGLTVEDYVLVVNANDNDAETIDDLLAQENLSFGTAGVGTASQLSQKLLLGQAGVSYRDVPMDGGGPTLTALLGSQVDAATVQLAEAGPYLEDGTFIPLVTFGEERSEFLPDVPTATEEGYDVVVEQLRFIAGPEGLPDEVISTYQDSVDAAFEDEEFLQFLEDNYISKWDIDVEDIPETLEDAKQLYQEKLDEYDITLNN